MVAWAGDNARGLPIEVDPPSTAQMPSGGIWYQPRSLWGAAYIQNAVLLPEARIQFEREQLRNGTRWPVTIERVALTPINYPIEHAGDPVLAPASPWGMAYAALQGALIRISSPFRKSFARQEIAVGAYPAMATGQPLGEETYQSSLFGISYLEFDKPLFIPQRSACMFGLGGLTGVFYDPVGAAEISFARPQASPIFATMYFNEVGGLFSGSQRRALGQMVPDFPNQSPQPDPSTGYPFPLPVDYSEVPGAPGALNWPPQMQLTGKQFGSQESTRSGSTHVYGMGAMIDQIEYDDDAASDAQGTGIDVDGGGFKISQLAARMGCRARMTHGVNTDEWWRPGAPLALVLDSITPALVYKLPNPITLGPGDTLSVEVRMAGTDYFQSTLDSVVLNNAARLQLGISFNGYTAIEG